MEDVETPVGGDNLFSGLFEILDCFEEFWFRREDHMFGAIEIPFVII